MELKTLTLNGKTYDSFPFELTDADKQEIAELAAEMVEVPEGGTVTDEQIASAVEKYMSKTYTNVSEVGA